MKETDNQPNKESDIEQASVSRRTVAFLIDQYIILFFISLAAFFSFFADVENTDFNKIGTMVLLALFSAFLLLSLKDSIRGISIGKWIMGLAIRDSSDSNNVPSFARLFLRNISLFLAPIEFIVLAINRKQRLGDKIAKTVVIKNPKKAQRSLRIFAGIVILIATSLSQFFFILNSFKNSEAYKTAINAIEESQGIKEIVGPIKEYGIFPEGSIQISNGYGKAQFQITVSGEKDDLIVFLYLEKEPGGEWTVLQMKGRHK